MSSNFILEVKILSLGSNTTLHVHIYIHTPEALQAVD